MMQDRAPITAFRATRYTDRQAWDWLRQHAAREPARVEVRGTVFRLHAGQMVVSMRGLARLWGWSSESAVRAFLTRMQEEGRIDAAPGALGTVVTLCNPEDYAPDVSPPLRSEIRTLRRTASDCAALIRWAQQAKQGDVCTYHVGNLAVDRARSRVLHDLAELVQILSEFEYLTTASLRTQLPMLDGYSYIATRTGQGYAPRGLLHQAIEPMQWRAVVALRDRQAAQSATRALRDGLSVSERVAVQMLADLRKAGWIEDTPGKGIEVTADGLRVVG